MKPRILFLFMLLCAAIASVQRVHGFGETITVTNINDSGAGSLRWALARADDFDFINFSVTGTITLTSGQLFVGKPVFITGPGANNLTVDANQASRAFYVDAPFGSFMIRGLAITNGNADFGGGMYVASGLFVSDCTFTGNSASQFGGGIYIGSGAFLSLQDSTVAANSISAGGEGGGGIYNDHATLQVGNSTITNNSAFRGGGIYNDHATLQVVHSTIINNDGNGIYNDGALPGNATLTIYNSTIANNHTSGDNGGGIYNDHASLEVVYSTIANNFSFEGSGGGIYNDGSYPGNATLTIYNSTLSGNSVSGSGDFHHDAGNGGAIFNNGGAFGSAPVTITNSTLSGNSAIEQDEEPSGGNGGGIYNYAAPVTITNSTLSGNAAYRMNPTDFQFENGNGSGIYNWGGTLMIGDTILDAGSSFTNPPGANIFNDRGTVTSLGYNLSSDAADGDSTAGPGGLLNHTCDVRNTDPVLGALQDNGGPSFTHALLPSSPAIDAGTDLTALNGAVDDMTTGVTVTDATGFSQVFGLQFRSTARR
jgi:predicted outer membrane repeat protein